MLQTETEIGRPGRSFAETFRQVLGGREIARLAGKGAQPRPAARAAAVNAEQEDLRVHLKPLTIRDIFSPIRFFLHLSAIRTNYGQISLSLCSRRDFLLVINHGYRAGKSSLCRYRSVGAQRHPARDDRGPNGGRRRCARCTARDRTGGAARPKPGSQGGRLIYVGAGTSGRLAVQDGAELIPTFNWPQGALVAADGRRQGGAAAVGGKCRRRNRSGHRRRSSITAIGAPDVVIAVAASGTTPFTLTCLREAKSRGALHDRDCQQSRHAAAG